MIIDNPTVSKTDFEAGTGWTFKPEGACKGDTCIPLAQSPEAELDAPSLAAQLGLPVVHESKHGLWSIGPESVNGRALTTALAPALSLPDLAGNLFQLSSLRGQKVLVYAWAPY